MLGDRWVFGYGSLVWRPAFVYEQRAAAAIRGFARRFWQGSPDHRGSPEAPGRVVTLAEEPNAWCAGVAYRVAPAHWPEVLDALDLRESGGFERHSIPLHFREAANPAAEALVYVAGPANPNFLGPAPARKIAEQVRRCRGQSGSNLEYALELAVSLERLGVRDDHVAEIAALLRDGGL